MATITAAAGGGNWGTGGTWVGGVVPTAADDVILNASSGNVTINGTSGSPSRCRSLNCTGYTGTLTHNVNTYLNVGDASGGSLTLVSGMTYTPSFGAVIQFVSTTTGNTITSAGKTLPNLTFNGLGGGWTLADALIVNANSTITSTAGNFSTSGFALTAGKLFTNSSSVRTINISSSTVTLQNSNNAVQFSNTSNLTLTTTGSTVSISGALGGQLDFGANTTWATVNITYSFSSGSSNSTTGMTGFCTFGNLSIITSNSNDGRFHLGNDINVTGTLTLTGYSYAKRLVLASTSAGTRRTITAATVSATYAGMQDITGAGAGSWDLSSITGFCADCGNNSGITFTSPVTTYFKSAVSADISDNSKWFTTSGGSTPSRSPLPQDTGIFDANSFTGAGSWNLSLDSNFIGALDFTGVTNNPSLQFAVRFFFGNVTLISAMTISSGSQFNFMARRNVTFTTNGKSLDNPVVIEMPSYTFSLGSDLTIATPGNSITLSAGTFSMNNYNCSVSVINLSANYTRVFNRGTGTLSLTGTGTVWNGSTSQITYINSTSTIDITNTSATAKTFSGSGASLGNIKITGDNITISGANTFGTFTLNNQGLTNGLKLTSSVTQTITSLVSNGSVGNLCKVLSTTTGTRATISCANPVDVNYVDLKDLAASGAVPFYAGPNSTNSGNNLNWGFYIRPTINASIAGAASVAAAGYYRIKRTATVAGVGAVSTTGFRKLYRTSTIAGVGAVSGVGFRRIYANSTIGAAATVTVASFRKITNSANISAASSTTIYGFGVVFAVGTASGASTVSGNGSAYTEAIANISASSSLTAYSFYKITSDAALTGSSTVVARPSVVEQIESSAAITASSNLTAVGAAKNKKEASLSGSSSLNTALFYKYKSTSEINGSASISAYARSVFKVSAYISGSSALTPAEFYRVSSNATLSGSSNLNVNAVSRRVSTTNISGTSTVVANHVSEGIVTIDELKLNIEIVLMSKSIETVLVSSYIDVIMVAEKSIDIKILPRV